MLDVAKTVPSILSIDIVNVSLELSSFIAAAATTHGELLLSKVTICVPVRLGFVVKP